jgi:hemerythrin
MPNRVHWNPDYSVGNEILDGQHKAILAHCNKLADCITDTDPQRDQKFNDSFATLLVQAHEHFSTEEALLSRCGYPAMEEHQNEHDEFDYLANEIITTKNFEQVELQRFLVLWWVGHLIDSAKKYRPFVEG